MKAILNSKVFIFEGSSYGIEISIKESGDTSIERMLLLYMSNIGAWDDKLVSSVLHLVWLWILIDT